MVTSPPQSPTKRQKRNFPLFSKLLLEGLNCRRSSNPTPGLECPATAPVLPTDSLTRAEQPLKSKTRIMADKAEHLLASSGDTTTDPELIQPITLQDPPKSKLKRQLSIDTRETQEKRRIHKKPNLGYHDQAAEDQESPTVNWRKEREHCYLRSDEVDGGPPSTTAGTGEGLRQQYPAESRRKEPPPRVNISPPKSYYVHDSRLLHAAVPDGGDANDTHSIPGQVHSEMPIKSPSTLFDLNDIGLTSPFMNTTPRGTNNAKPVFIYPESTSPRPRKTSPYKHPVEYSQSPPRFPYDRTIRHATTTEGKLPEVLYPPPPSENLARDVFQDDLKRHPSLTAQEPDINSSGNTIDSTGGALPKYVTSKGFDWSLSVTITEATPFSPRIVTSEARPRFSSTTTTSFASPAPHPSPSRQASRYDSHEENVAKLHRLEREYKRALDILGCPEAFHSQVLRSLSAVDRSPNEKNIRETREDVRNKYERMFSFPVTAPRISQYLSQQGQREEPRAPGNAEQELRFQQPRSWLSDARRRLFARSDSYYGTDRRPTPPYSPERPGTSQGSTDIPDEVLQFLHSKNFHPEELQNLKEFLRRGGTPSVGSTAGHVHRTRSNTGHEGEGHGVPRYEMESEYRRGVSYDQHFGPTRERRRGDIDVRLSCESVIPSKSTQEILRDMDHDTTECRCSKIEDAIRQMALQVYSKVIPSDSSPAAFNQFQSEFNETNLHVYDAMQFLCGVKCMCKYGRTLEEVYNGSVVFRLNCPNIDALLDLWHEYRSGNLLRELQEAFVTDELKKRFDCEAITLNVLISQEEYRTCKAELEAVLRSQISNSPKKSPGAAIFHARSRSEPASVTKQANQLLVPKKKLLSPFRERYCSDSSAELSPRRAFQEINVSKDMTPICSPSKKLDNVFFNDDIPTLTSPKRHQFQSSSPQGEQENVGQSVSRIQSPRQSTFQELPWSDNRNERVTHV